MTRYGKKAQIQKKISMFSYDMEKYSSVDCDDNYNCATIELKQNQSMAFMMDGGFYDKNTDNVMTKAH